MALQNKRVMYGILFRAAAETLQELSADPKHLGARVGILMVLHTWGQNLMHHPHVHSVVTGGWSLGGQLTLDPMPTNRGQAKAVLRGCENPLARVSRQVHLAVVSLSAQNRPPMGA